MAERLRAQLIGPFRLELPDGREVQIKGAKDRALICLLCLSRNRKRARSVLQDKLWSDRGQEQGAASLRQSLSSIRRALGPARDLLATDRKTVALNEARIACDIDDVGVALSRFSNPNLVPELFEDLLHIDPEFDDWARDQRSAFYDQVDDHFASTNIALPVPGGREVSDLQVELQGDFASGPVDRQFTMDGVLTALTEVSGMRPAWQADGADRSSDATFTLVARAWTEAGLPGLTVRSGDGRSGRPIWQTTQLGSETQGGADLQRSVNTLADTLLYEMKRHVLGDPEQIGSAIRTMLAADTIFRRRGRNGAEVRKLLDPVETTGSGIQLAWQAFLSTYLVGERLSDDPASASDEAEALARRAIELQPMNSMVLALSSYVYSFLRHDFFTGYELAARARTLNPSNPLAQAFFGCANVYLGRAKEGYEACLHARRIAGPGPYRYLVDTLCFIAAASSGRFDDAVALAESTRRQTEGYAPPLRYLVAIHRHRNEFERAEEVAALLRKIEPDFSPEIMREREYPMQALRDSELLKL